MSASAPDLRRDPSRREAAPTPTPGSSQRRPGALCQSWEEAVETVISALGSDYSALTRNPPSRLSSVVLLETVACRTPFCRLERHGHVGLVEKAQGHATSMNAALAFLPNSSSPYRASLASRPIGCSRADVASCAPIPRLHWFARLEHCPASRGGYEEILEQIPAMSGPICRRGRQELHAVRALPRRRDRHVPYILGIAARGRRQSTTARVLRALSRGRSPRFAS